VGEIVLITVSFPLEKPFKKLPSINPSGNEYRLVSLMALKEAGERHHDLNGGVLMSLRRQRDTARRQRRSITKR
jgi:hypothetical protein